MQDVCRQLEQYVLAEVDSRGYLEPLPAA